MESPTYIHNAEKVTEQLGYWPSFHDAEIISFSVARAMLVQAAETCARLCVHVREYKEVGAGTADYEIVCSKSLLIELMLLDVQHLFFEGFNHQNVINSIGFRRLANESIEVEIESIYGVGGVICCARAEVTDITRML